MEGIYTNVNSIILNQLSQTSQTTTKTTTNPISTILKNTYSTNPIETSISDSAELSTSAIDNFYSIREENVVSGMDLIQATSDALGEMRSNLSFLRQVLRESETYNDEYGVLMWLDEQSNKIIDTILDIFNNTEYNGVKVFSGEQSFTSNAMIDNYQNFVFSLGNPSDTSSNLIINTKINLEGLQAIRGLSLDDENYETRIDEILAEINQKREYLYNKQSILNTVAQSIYDENMSSSDKVQSSSDIQKQILNNAASTLTAVTQGLSAENILQFFVK